MLFFLSGIFTVLLSPTSFLPLGFSFNITSPEKPLLTLQLRIYGCVIYRRTLHFIVAVIKPAISTQYLPLSICARLWTICTPLYSGALLTLGEHRQWPWGWMRGGLQSRPARLHPQRLKLHVSGMKLSKHFQDGSWNGPDWTSSHQQKHAWTLQSVPGVLPG